MMRKIILSLVAITSFLFSFSQTITVTYPNGGEVIAGCTSRNITWTASGTSNFFTIDYSTDGGTNWTSVTSFLSNTSGVYSWTVPNINSSNCIVRVKDSNTPSIVDQSNSSFTITAPLILTAPNGGEKWTAGTTRSITWAATGTSNRYRIEYSTNAGSSWNTITSNVYNTSGIYNWNVVNSPSTTALIRVTDYSNSCMTDKSDNLFELKPPVPTLTLTSPNGGNLLYSGKSYTIRWNSSNLTSSLIALDYSTDTGNTWTPIVTGITNTGSHSWTVPNTPSTTCKIRVKAVGTNLSDISNSNFTIRNPFITVLTPSGSENWQGCNSYYIRWAHGGITNNRFTLQYSTDNGVNWATITSNLYQSSTSNSSYRWTVPNNVQGQALVRIRDYNNASTYDDSDSPFNLSRNTSIIVTAPNGGESWEAGKVKTISWVDNAITYFRVQYSSNGGSSWSNINSRTSANSINWTVPNNPGNNYKIRVSDYSNSCKMDESDSAFTVTPPTPYINVTRPTSSTSVYPFQSLNIRWNSGYLTSAFVKIEFSTDSGSTWGIVQNVTNNDGTENWTVPNVISDKCFIRVSEYGNPSLNDMNTLPFSIAKPFIRLTSPNGGETWKGCDSRSITWTVGGGSNSYRLDYSLDSGTTWTYITQRSGTSYSWLIPAKLSSNKALIRVRDLTRNIGDTIDNPMIFTPNTDIIVTTPNGGETWEAATTKNISWVDNGVSWFRVYYSTNGGSNWTYINSRTSANSINWSVPNNPGFNYKIKVQDYNNSCKYDESDTVFTVTAPTPRITVTSPNGGSYYPQQSTTIRWSSAYLTSSFVNIEFSSDSGSTWNTVVSSTSNDGSHPWTVPNNISTNCFVRISESGSPQVNDLGNRFQIRQPYLTLTAPLGGQVWKGCETQNIRWTVGGGSGTYRLEYSTDSGSTWNYITNSSSTSYNWTIPSKASSNKTFVRVRDLSRNMTSQSTTPLTLIPNTDIIVTTPNGGESWEVGTTKNVAWVDNNVSTFRIYYSSNGGANWSYIDSYHSSNSRSWTIPNNPGNNYKVKVEDYNNSCKYDESDSIFSVTPPTPRITVSRPSAGSYYPQQTLNIRWTSSYLNSAFVTIEYSSDSGATWSVISAVTNNDGSENWTTPNTLSNNYFVRVSEYGTPSVNDWSSRFSVIAPHITLNAPNGGESWKGCQTQTISWTVGGGSNNYRLEYSTDSGSTWTYITQSSGSSYSWNIPAKLSSIKMKFRVRDISRNMSDESNNVFTIIPNTDIIVTSPNGGESWEAATTKNISWVDNGVSNFRVYYSVNAGSSWTYITSNTSANSINWSVPNNPGSNYKIRVVDRYNSCKYDESDSLFTVTPPQPRITVTRPNSVGLYPQQSYTIQWSSAYLNSSFVNIDFSSDSGTTWSSVVSSTSNDGSHSWVVPNAISNNCYIRVSEVGSPTIYDWSSKFRIQEPFIRMNYPNGGETINGCTSQNISWTVGGGSGTYRLEYSIDSGATWTYLTNRSSTSYSWSVPGKLSSNKALFRVLDLSRNMRDTSDATFRFTPNQDIIVSTPNGGETYAAGYSKRIEWVDNGVSRFRVYYSTNGSNWTYITSNTYNNYQNWTTPNTPGTNYRIRVQDYYNSCKYDESDSAFTVLPPVPYLNLTYPNGGNAFYQGQSINIRWNSGHLTSPYVRLDYSLDSGLTWNTISNVTNNDGSENWSVPTVNTTKALVRVSEYGNSSRQDISASTFTIQPSIVLTAPNGGNGQNEYRGCTVTSIKWNAGGTSNRYRIEYSLNGGTNWTTINSNFYSSSSSPTYNWTMPNTASNNVLVRVRDRSDYSKADQSDFPFKISAPIILNKPNQGGTYYVGETMYINWTSNGTSNYYNIDYSTNGGTTWNSIAFNHNTSGNSYAWVVPGTISNNCKIRITDNINNCKKTESIIPFKIVSGTRRMTVTSPSGGENWAGCTQKTISWTDGGNSAAYKIEYSSNAGNTWTTIQSSYATATRTYNWSVPSTVGSAYLIRVSDASDPTKTDQSDSTFDVTNSSVPVVSAIGNTTICGGNSVQLTCDKTTGITWYPGGYKTQSISVTTPGSYYVIYSDSSGCNIQSNTISVNSGTPPAAPIITASGATKFCLGGSVILSTNQTSGIEWFPGGQTSQTITATIGGNYTVTYTDANGCKATSNPMTITTNSIPTISKSNGNVCLGDTVTLTSSSATGNRWFPTGDTSSTIRVANNGNYSVQVTDADNCVATSQVDTIRFEPKPAAPTISASGNLSFCPGENVVLTATPKNNITWSVGIADSSITLDSATTVYATYTNSGGCQSQSNTVTTNLLTPPTKPIVSAIGDTNLCQGDSVTLVSSASNNQWSNGATSASIVVNSSGYYSTETTGSNGCKSTSTPLLVSVNAIPAKPLITANGPLTFCSGDSVILSSNNPSGNKWSTGDLGTSITVKSAGVYAVDFTNSNGCTNSSLPVTVSVNSAPTKPVITASNGLSFCQGDSTVLTSSFLGKNVWSTGDTTSSITVKASGNITVKAQNANSCESPITSALVTMNTKPATPSFTISDTGALCIGDTITLTSNTASGNRWSTGDSSSSIRVSSSATVSLRTRNAFGCESDAYSKSFNFGNLPAQPSISALGNTTFCAGDSVTLSSSSPTGNTWSNGATSQQIVVKATGNYTVKTTSSNGCSRTSMATSVVANTAPSAPQISIVGDTTFCQGDSVWLISSKSGGNRWSNNTTSDSLLVKNTGNYSVTYSNPQGCFASSNSVRILVNTMPSTPGISLQGLATFCEGDSAVLTSSVSGNNVWSNGDTSNSIVVKSSGNYSVKQVHASGCEASSAPMAITKLNAPAQAQLLLTGDSTFCDGDSLIVSTNHNNGLVWSNGDTTSSIKVTTSQAVWVKHTASNGCETTSRSLTVQVNPVPAKPSITASGATTFCSGDSVKLTSSNPSGNTWSTGDTANFIYVSTSGNYSVTQENAFGCKNQSQAIAVTRNIAPAQAQLLLTGDSTFCDGDSLIVSTNHNNGLVWSNGDTTSSVKVTTSQAVWVKHTASNGCETTSRSLTVQVNPVPAKPSITASGATTFCSGDSVKLTSSNPSGNTWSTGDTANFIYVSTSGNYSVTQENAFGCKNQSLAIAVTQNTSPAQPQLQIAGDTVLCSGDSAVVSTNYATGLNWSTGDTTSSIVVKSGKFVNVMYTSPNGCTALSKTVEFKVNATPTIPLVSVTGNPTFCSGDSAILTSSVINNNVWSTGDTTQSIVVKASGNYSVTQTSAKGCSSTSSVKAITRKVSPAKPQLLLTGDTTFCNGDSAIVATNFNSGLMWSNGDTSNSVVIKSGQFLSLTHTATNGCSSTSDQINFTVNPTPVMPTISASGSTAFCSGDSVVLTSSSLMNNTWSNGDTTSSITVKNTGSHSVTVNNNFGCNAVSNPTMVTVHLSPAKPTLSLVGDSIFCNGDSALVSSSYSKNIVWSNGDTNASQIVKNSANLSVTYTDSNSCKVVSDVVRIRVNPVPATPTITANGPLTFCQGGDVRLTSSSAAGNAWSNLDTTSSILVSQSGLYSVQVKNSFNCAASSAPVQVTVNALPAIPTVSITGDTTFCDGDSVQLATNYINGITWSNSDTTSNVTLKISGIYSVTYVDTNSCSATSRSIQVTRNPVPATPTILASGALQFCDGGSVTLNSSSANNNTWSTNDTTASILVKQSGNYSVEVENQFGCKAQSANTLVTVHQLPSTPSITANGPTNICLGDSVLLSSSSLRQNRWSTSDTTQGITVKSTGIYSLSVVDTNGCSSASVSQSVTVRPAPVAPIISANGPLGFCQGDSVLLSSNVLTGIVWSSGDTTQTIKVTSSGNYTAKVSNSAGCESTSNVLQVKVGSRPATPSISTIGDTTFCVGDSVRLLSSSANGNRWSTGDSTTSIVVKNAGTIGLKVIDNGCVSSETTQLIQVNNNPVAPQVSVNGDTTFCPGDSVELRSSYSMNNLWSNGAGNNQTATVKSAGMYNVTYTDSNGCKAVSRNVSVSLFKTPQAPFVSPGGTVEICEGKSTVLRSSISTGLSWNTNQSPIDSLVVNKAGSYFVNHTDNNGCSVQSNTVTVSLLALPAQPVITQKSEDLESTQGDSYQWYKGGVKIDGAIGQTHRPTENGVYQVEITNASGCSILSTPFTFNAVGIAQTEFVESLKLYPNPTQGTLNMDLRLMRTSTIDIVILSLTGQIVHQETISPSDVQVARTYDLNGLANGMYQFELRTVNSSYSERITINK